MCAAETFSSIIDSGRHKFKRCGPFGALFSDEIQPLRGHSRDFLDRGLAIFFETCYYSLALRKTPSTIRHAALGYRPTAGHLTLDQRIGVRIPVSQPFLCALFVQWPRTSGSQPGNRGSNPLESAIFFILARKRGGGTKNIEALHLQRVKRLVFYERAGGGRFSAASAIIFNR